MSVLESSFFSLVIYECDCNILDLVFSISSLSKDNCTILMQNFNKREQTMTNYKKSILSIGMSVILSPYLSAAAGTCQNDGTTFTVMSSDGDFSEGTLLSCVDHANNVADAKVVFSPNLSNSTINLSNSAVFISGTENLTIDGGTNNIIIDGNINSVTPGVFRKTKPGSITLKNLTIQNATNTAVAVLDGSAIIDSCTFRNNNTAINISNGDYNLDSGAAINALVDTNLTISNSTFESNTAYHEGGAIYSGSEVLTIDNSTFTNNAVTADSGGAIFSAAKHSYISNSTLSKNSAGRNGAGLVLASLGTESSARIVNSIIKENSIDGSSHASTSGGAFISVKNFTLENSTISENSGVFAAGLLAIGSSDSSKITIIDSNISNNSAVQVGGAYFTNIDEINISNSIISGNSASHDIGGCDFQSMNKVNINSSTISGNSAAYQTGGLYFSAMNAINISSSSISENTAGSRAGGLFCLNVNNIDINSSTISGNTAQRGGGLYFIQTEDTNITNSTISGNSAAQEGGGASFYYAYGINISDTTITNNSARNTGGISTRDSNYPMIQNTILSGNTATQGAINDIAIINSNSNGNNILGMGVQGYIPEDIRTDDPRLEALANNGGLTKTHALLPDSPAIENGSSIYSKDQRGSQRGVNGKYDIGAYEVFQIFDSEKSDVVVTTNTSAPATIEKMESMPADDINDDFRKPAGIWQDGVDLHITSTTNGFSTTLIFDQPAGSLPFAGYAKYGKKEIGGADVWYNIGTLNALATGVGYTISNKGLHMEVKLVDGLIGDDDLTENGVIIDPGFPIINLRTKNTNEDSSVYTLGTTTTVTKSTPISSTVKGAMALLFAAVAFLGFRRKERLS